jgi:hypothetical protein
MATYTFKSGENLSGKVFGGSGNKRPKKRPEGLKPVGFGSDNNGPKASSKSSGSGGKGGGKTVDPSTSKGQKAITASRTEKSGFGYYNDAGKYVPAYVDMFDGGGMNTSDTYFAGGPLSNILNVMKVAPKGSGDVPRERIGYRDLTDMFDQGGPQASGGGFRGAGGFSGIGNIANMLTGNQSERVGYYDEGGRFYEPPAAPASSGVLGSGQNTQRDPVNDMVAGENLFNYPVMGPEDFAPYPKEPLAPAPSVQSEMNLPDAMNYGGGLTMQFQKPMIKDETFFDPVKRSYRKGFSDVNLVSDMVAPTMAPTTLSNDGGRLQQMKADLSAMGFDPMGFNDADVMELHKLYVGGIVE